VVTNGVNISGISSITNMEELDIGSGSPLSVTVGSGQLDDFTTIASGSNPFTINAASAGTYSLAGKTLGGAVTLVGSSGVDTLTGSSGNDTITGGAGADTISGGNGNDTFNINSTSDASGDVLDGGSARTNWWWPMA
jgi:Ca2+-binding RTX toxin-like protein